LGLPNPDFGFELGATTNPKSAFANPDRTKATPHRNEVLESQFASQRSGGAERLKPTASSIGGF
jgi:hypothetical protein